MDAGNDGGAPVAVGLEGIESSDAVGALATAADAVWDFSARRHCCLAGDQGLRARTLLGRGAQFSGRRLCMLCWGTKHSLHLSLLETFLSGRPDRDCDALVTARRELRASESDGPVPRLRTLTWRARTYGARGWTSLRRSREERCRASREADERMQASRAGGDW
jgi:hypothetical protein